MHKTAKKNVQAVTIALSAINHEAMADVFHFSLPLLIPCSSDFSPHLNGLEAFTKWDGLNLHFHLHLWWPKIADVFH